MPTLQKTQPNMATIGMFNIVQSISSLVGICPRPALANMSNMLANVTSFCRYLWRQENTNEYANCYHTSQVGLARRLTDAIGQICLPCVTSFVSPLGSNSQAMTMGNTNGKVSYVNNDASIGANAMSQIGYQLLRTTTMPMINRKVIGTIMRKYFGIQCRSK